LLGTSNCKRTDNGKPLDGVPAMALLLGCLLLFSMWLPKPVLEVIQQAAGIIGDKQ
jgi:hypothetical protein